MAKLFQHGTLAMLVDGLFGGTIDSNELLKHGDFGIGTAEGLNGELIVLNGVIYQALADGSVQKVNDEMLPFADVNWSKFENRVQVENANMQNVDQLLSKEAMFHNTFVAIKLTGTFDKVQTRVVEKQERPYPGLSETASQQKVFDAQTISGTVVGYYTPELFNGAGVAGMHLHFLDDKHQFGGHLLGFEATKAVLSWQILDGLDLELPTGDSEFMGHHPSSMEDVHQSISESEK
ncbi:acetolactate decarboxylase [Pediococcus claussenii]|uniref:Alpha-acetolactate decarboxylase n=1 Tax=Pediococcus claussenii (strain ATCC BAA-344 / DSM 14800 / JCM 18046 / KCTC 3811 / LMG 21948 / P06) TaxID=701521 RepID=G8PEH5_PEDCP|nr:acetolactate decarboxylase [Pediococcus claussenii]AEV95584.1 alpha-acetolactate decarboxylase [Pediococcus claussenii ATCC BAA-344]ANZ69105.1 alpha-acetolactate decarboxylase [Pediococcus claussenii]ANZ70922.1 alpha-acetolactate decarboxylase [Pediococcus claussenii]KRN20183.1 alsD protein [Pediococcus claussenii]